MKKTNQKSKLLLDERQTSFRRGHLTARDRKANTLESLAVRSEQFDIALQHMPHGLCMFDQNTNLVLCNPAYAKLYALPSELTRAGVPLSRILEFRRLVGNAPHDFDHYFDVVRVALETGEFASTRIALHDGRTIQITHNPMPGGGYVATHEDVTAHVLAEQQRNYFASHDPLTKLLNRGAFISEMEARLVDEGGPHLVLQLLDLDDFKPVNDTFGHQTGDHVLQTVADRLMSLSQDQLVCRLGGDEFAVLQPAKLATMSAVLLIEAINEPIDFKFRHVKVGVSIGMATFEAQLSSEEFFHRADTALYVSKASGGNCATLYEQGMLMPAT